MCFHPNACKLMQIEMGKIFYKKLYNLIIKKI
jgi:hypothetical protein